MLISIDDGVWRVTDGEQALGWVEHHHDLGEVRYRARRVVERGVARLGDYDSPEQAAAAIADPAVQPPQRRRARRTVGSSRTRYLRRQWPVEG